MNKNLGVSANTTHAVLSKGRYEDKPSPKNATNPASKLVTGVGNFGGGAKPNQTTRHDGTVYVVLVVTRLEVHLSLLKLKCKIF